MGGADEADHLLVRFLRCLDEVTDVAVVAQELQHDRELRTLFVHREQARLAPAMP